MKRIVFLLVFISVVPGCLFLPVSGYHRGEIDKVHSQIVIGSTTREEVISILGPPDVTRDRFILYQNKEYDGGWFFIGIAPGVAGANISRQKFMDLYFEFDNYGVLTDYRVDKYDNLWKTVE